MNLCQKNKDREKGVNDDVDDAIIWIKRRKTAANFAGIKWYYWTVWILMLKIGICQIVVSSSLVISYHRRCLGAYENTREAFRKYRNHEHANSCDQSEMKRVSSWSSLHLSTFITILLSFIDFEERRNLQYRSRPFESSGTLVMPHYLNPEQIKL